MKPLNSRAYRDVLKHIRENYGFMLERGYELVSVDEYDLGWQAVLGKEDVLARIIRSRGEDEISFRTAAQSPDEFTDLGSLIHAATGEIIPRWESSDIRVIRQYLERVEDYFKAGYLRNKDSLRVAQEEYFAAFSQSGVPPRTAEEEFYAEFPQAGVLMPPEPKRKPLLYYPLMGVIILLILTGLATLGMILLDRLFSPF